MLPLLATIFLLACALVFIGRRGRTIGAHLHCARCGFDLSGRPADSTRCAECGADLTASRATRKGLRRRLPALVFSGIFLALESLAIAGHSLWKNWNTLAPYKPAWLLQRETQSPSGPLANAAFTELLSRINDGRLQGAALRSSIDLALAHQKDLARPWDPRYGDLIESALVKNAVEPPERNQFLSQMLLPRVKIRSAVRHGGPFPTFVDLIDRREPSLAKETQEPREARKILTWNSKESPGISSYP